VGSPSRVSSRRAPSPLRLRWCPNSTRRVHGLYGLPDEQGRQCATLTMAVAGSLAVTLAVIFTLGLAQISLGDPAIRLPAMALMTFLAMFSVRTFALGPISFLAGFIS